MYTLGALLGVLSFYFLLRGFSRCSPAASAAQHARAERTWRAWLGYVVCAALGLYTLYYFAFLLLFENLAVLAMLAWRRGAGALLPCRDQGLAGGAGGRAPALPALAAGALRQATQPPVPPWRGFTGLAAVLVESWAALSLGQSVQTARSAVRLLLLFVACCVAVALAESDRPAGDAAAAGLHLRPGAGHLPALAVDAALPRALRLPLRPGFRHRAGAGLAPCCRPARVRVAALALAVLLLAGLRSAQAYFYRPGLCRRRPPLAPCAGSPSMPGPAMRC